MARAMYSTDSQPAFEQSEYGPGYGLGSEELDASERIYAPPPGARENTMLQAAAVIAVLIGAGVAVHAARPVWENLLAAAPGASTPEHTSPPAKDAPPVVRAPKSRTEPAPGTAAAPASAAPETLVQREVEAIPGAETGTPVAAPATAAAATTTATETDDLSGNASAPLPPPVYDEKDPLKKRAADAGLHPDLSRALLTRLSSADYKNAKTAVGKAMSQPDNSAPVVWPADDKPKLARFEVRFVEGAPPTCRRYVVIVTKDRWATTAPPMEKCQPDGHKRGTKRAAAG